MPAEVPKSVPQPWAATHEDKGFCTERGRCMLARHQDCAPGTGQKTFRGTAAAQTSDVAEIFAESDLLIEVQDAESRQQDRFPHTAQNQPLKCNIVPTGRAIVTLINTDTGDTYKTDKKGILRPVSRGGGSIFRRRK